jgi:hypothetical protein
VLIVLWGCAGLTPQREWVRLKTSSSTRYYSVRGTTTGAIFDDIERNGLVDEQTLDTLRRQRDTTHASIDTVKAEMAKSGAAPPTC